MYRLGWGEGDDWLCTTNQCRWALGARAAIGMQGALRVRGLRYNTVHNTPTESCLAASRFHSFRTKKKNGTFHCVISGTRALNLSNANANNATTRAGMAAHNQMMIQTQDCSIVFWYGMVYVGGPGGRQAFSNWMLCAGKRRPFQARAQAKKSASPLGMR